MKCAEILMRFTVWAWDEIIWNGGQLMWCRYQFEISIEVKQGCRWDLEVGDEVESWGQGRCWVKDEIIEMWIISDEIELLRSQLRLLGCRFEIEIEIEVEVNVEFWLRDWTSCLAMQRLRSWCLLRSWTWVTADFEIGLVLRRSVIRFLRLKSMCECQNCFRQNF